MKEIILNNDEIKKVKDTFENNFKTYNDESGCLCCDFICDINDNKSIIVNAIVDVQVVVQKENNGILMKSQYINKE